MSFITDAIEAGFTAEQAAFLEERMAQYPHSHEIDEINGLEEVLAEEEDEEEED